MRSAKRILWVVLLAMLAFDTYDAMYLRPLPAWAQEVKGGITSVFGTAVVAPGGTTAANGYQLSPLGATYGMHSGSGSYVFSANNADVMTVNANAPVGLNINGTNLLQLGTVAFASLGTPANAVTIYCSDCTIANPCASGGTGAFAKRINGVWVCN